MYESTIYIMCIVKLCRRKLWRTKYNTHS